jgi:uncharacterized protein
MHHHRLSGETERRFLLVFDDCDELVEELTRFAAEQRISAGDFTGIGSLAGVEFDDANVPRPDGPAPLLLHPLDGTFVLADGVPEVRAYGVVTTEAGASCAGRIVRGVVRESLKLLFTESYSGNRARPSSTDTSPSALSDRTAS